MITQKKFRTGSALRAITRLLVLCALAAGTTAAVLAQTATPAATPKQPKPKPAPIPIPPPTMANVQYGPDPRQLLDFWKADSSHPTPLLFFIHGGGWMNDSKDMTTNSAYDVRKFLKAGISVVSINYRFLSDAKKAGINPPVLWPLTDAARALQFVRSKAAEWNIDKDCIGAGGSSAGACSSLWLAFHKDMADPKSADPVARESTRLACAGLYRAQTSLDPKEMVAWIPNMNYGAQAFGFWGGKDQQPYPQFVANREKVLPWIQEYSPYGLADASSPPVYIFYNTPPAMGQPQEATAHSANFGIGLQEKLKGLGVECRIAWPAAPDPDYHTPADFLIAKLQACSAKHKAATP